VSDQVEHEDREDDEPHAHDHDGAHDHGQAEGHDEGLDEGHDEGLDEGHDHDDHEHDDDGHDHDADHALIVDRLPAGVWQVVHGSSEVNFRAKALFGLLPVNGFFDEFSGELRVDEEGVASGRLVIQTGTLQTGIDRRDAELKSPRYLASQQHPQMTFTLESIEPSGDDHLDLTGNLVVREKTIPLSFPVYAIQHGDHLHVEGRVQVNHHAAGFDWAKPGMVAKSVRADVALTLTSAG
jgi:polyisoprenoid-binding protein YceI